MSDHRSQFEGKNVLITGGLGFIGSNLAIKLIDLKANIEIVDALIPECGGNIFNIKSIENKVKIHLSDLNNFAKISDLVKNKDYLFNLAGQVSHINSIKDPYSDLRINCQNQISILEACRKNNPDIKIIFTGTRQVYGKINSLPVSESCLPMPVDPNGINKLAGEYYHILYNNVYGIKTTSLRLTNTYGPRQFIKNSKQGFVPWFIRQAIDGKTIKIFGDGNQIRDFNYVDDVVEALLLAAISDKANGQIFNLGGTSVTLLKFTELLFNIIGGGKYKIVPFPKNRQNIDIGNYCGDYSKIKNMLNWQPSVSLKKGLSRTIAYYKKYKKYYW
ncbi:NAD-dependent epimerase/dehydratase family protein [bacterium]|nr:NAD-dependent epimerase/dehydratase family protein [bacterium]